MSWEPRLGLSLFRRSKGNKRCVPKDRCTSDCVLPCPSMSHYLCKFKKGHSIILRGGKWCFLLPEAMWACRLSVGGFVWSVLRTLVFRGTKGNTKDNKEKGYQRPSSPQRGYRPGKSGKPASSRFACYVRGEEKHERAPTQYKIRSNLSFQKRGVITAISNIEFKE